MKFSNQLLEKGKPKYLSPWGMVLSDFCCKFWQIFTIKHAQFELWSSGSKKPRNTLVDLSHLIIWNPWVLWVRWSSGDACVVIRKNIDLDLDYISPGGCVPQAGDHGRVRTPGLKGFGSLTISHLSILLYVCAWGKGSYYVKNIENWDKNVLYLKTSFWIRRFLNF